MIELQQIIALKRELLGRETCSRSPINYSEGMADDQKDRFIQYLAEQHREDELTKKAMELVLEDFMARQKELDEKMSDRCLKAAEREICSLREQLGQANEERYGEKRQRVRKRKDSGGAEKPEADRNGEKDDFDGTEGSLRTDSVDTGCPQTRLIRGVPGLNPQPPNKSVTCPTVLTRTSVPAWRVLPCIIRATNQRCTGVFWKQSSSTCSASACSSLRNITRWCIT